MLIEPLQVEIWQSYFNALLNDYGVCVSLCQYSLIDDSSQVVVSSCDFKDNLSSLHNEVNLVSCRNEIRPATPLLTDDVTVHKLEPHAGSIWGHLICSQLREVDEQLLEKIQHKTAALAGVITVNILAKLKTDKPSDAVFKQDIEIDYSIKIQDFLDSFSEHMWIKNHEGKYIACNKSVKQSWNMEHIDIIGKTDNMLFDERTANKFVDGDNKAITAGKKTIVDECEVIDLHGCKVWHETVKTPLTNVNGDLIGVIGFSRSIEHTKKTEEQLILAANVFENAVEGVIITDADGNITDINKSFTRITGYQRDEVIGQNPRLLRSGRHDVLFYQKLWNTLLVSGKWHGEIWNRRKNGSVFPQLVTMSTVYTKNKQISYFVAVFADISDQKQTEEKLKHLAYYDPLTQLPNRMQFRTSLEQEINHAQRSQTQLAVIFLDVDFFKNINDSLGHLIGDEIIVELGNRLTYALSKVDIIARIGGDEFAILLPKISGTGDVSSTINLLRSVFEHPFHVSKKQPVRLTASMGVSIYPTDGTDSDSLLRHADSAVYRAKSDGRNNFAFYTESMTQASVEQLKVQTALHLALTNKAFYLHYQPKVCLKTREVIGFEALIRWDDPELGRISPGVFIPLAEKIGLIVDIGSWVLYKACRQGVEWLNQGKQFGKISVNVACLQLQRSDFVKQVQKTLLETGLPARNLELEVTETSMMHEPEKIITMLNTLRSMGVTLSIDDFGTGFSSMNYLKDLPIDVLKIDQSFIRDIPFDADNKAIAKAVIALGHAIDTKVIAEGVETQQQIDFLNDNGCDYVQGYFFSKPAAPEQLSEFLAIK